MKNTMAKEMTQRYDDYKSSIEERSSKKSSKSLYYWVMSTIESIFWSQRCDAFVVNLYANNWKIFLVFRDSDGKERNFVYYLPYEYDDEKMKALMHNFVSIFNNIEYPLSASSTSPTFLANDFGVWKHSGDEEKYKGYYRVNIVVDMYPYEDN